MKKELITGVVSLCTAAATYMELGRKFESGDMIHGKVGLIYKIGRIGIKVTASYLAFIFSDAVVGGALKKISDSVNMVKDSVNIVDNSDTEEKGDGDDGESDEDSEV